MTPSFAPSPSSMATRRRIGFAAALMLCHACVWAAAPKPLMADPYLDLTAAYAVYAKDHLWHDADVGGYWGKGGIGEKDGNGAVRGMCNSMLGYCMLAKATKEEWLTPDAQKRLAAAGLDRAALLDYARKNLMHVAAHHKSAQKPLAPVWGDHWQSPLWLSAAGFGSFLIWDDLSEEQKLGLKTMARHEADRIASIPPNDYKPGNTAAEENAWDQLAPALALALEPGHANAGTWEKALRAYAVNTYSTPADRKSTATVGVDKVSEIVTTTNAFDDFTLDNHGFFHPDYVQVSGQHLGEAWLLLALGDRIHGTKNAEAFVPYSLHHVKDVWDNVTSKLLLPHGEFAFPSGNDWTYHCSMNQSYLAFVATALQDPLAQLAERRAIAQAQRRREVSPPGRILGDTNLEWWWEPLLIKRCSTALLHHMLREAPEVPQATEDFLDRGTWTKRFGESNVWLHRNGSYLASVSWGKRRMGTLFPFSEDPLKHPYMTLPVDDGIAPDQVERIVEEGETGAVLELKGGGRLALVCLPGSAVWISSAPLRPIGIENDGVTGPGRTVRSASGATTVAALDPHAPFDVEGPWVNIDNSFGHVAAAQGYKYTPAGKLNRRSAAIDRLTPAGEEGVWQMVPAVTSEETEALAKVFSVKRDGGRIEVVVQDGAGGGCFRIAADLSGGKSGGPSGKPGPLNSVSVVACQAP